MERLTYKTENGWVGINEQEDKFVSPTSIAIHKLCELEDVMEKYGIESAEDLDKFIHHKDCQIEKWKQDYENCSKLEKSMSKEHQYCLDNWRACERELTELKQKAIILPEEIQVGGKIFWSTEDGVYCGKLCGITKDINPNGGFNIWLYCLYDNGLSYWHLIQDYGIELFATKEEAEQKLAEIKGEKDE